MTKKIPVVETFGPTIQGEGAMIGTPTWFLRTGGCDFKCTSCDSMHAVDPVQVNKAPRLTGAELGTRLLEEMGHIHWVTFSGGNPCIWPELEETCSMLTAKGKSIALETQGTIIPEWLHQCMAVTISPKTPGMGEKCSVSQLDKFVEVAREQCYQVILKVVVFDEVDLDLAEKLHKRYAYVPFYISQGNRYFDSTLDDVVRAQLYKEYFTLLDIVYKRSTLADVRVLPQLHVWLWGNQRGV